MNMDKPVWNAQAKQESIARFAQWLNEEARIIFLHDEMHPEIFFLMDEAGEGGPIAMPSDVDKETVAQLLREEIKELHVYGFVHVAQTLAHVSMSKPGPAGRQWVEGIIETSKLEPGKQAEALMVHVESRDGYSRLWLSPIVRSTGRVALAEALEITQGPQGCFSGMFQ
ncbi:MAG: hypothetical protein V2A34_08195 [Lentisphaerota bacterium]